MRLLNPLPPEYDIRVESLRDLPLPVDGIVTLEAGRNYRVVGTVDLMGARLVCAGVVSIEGASSEVSVLKSTGLAGEALITSVYSLPLNRLTITADIALDLQSAGAMALDWAAVNFTDCGAIGYVKAPTNLVMKDCASLNSGALTLDGSIASFVMEGSLLSVAAGEAGIIIPDTCTITRRIRINDSVFIVPPTSTGIEIEDLASFPLDESFILSTVNASGGGTYVSGITVASNKALIRDCVGIENTRTIGQLFMNSNATATTIGSIETYVKVAGTTTVNDDTLKFSHTNNRLTYTGARVQRLAVRVEASFTTGNSNEVRIRIAKNGETLASSTARATTGSGNGRFESLSAQAPILMASGDYVEVWIGNWTETSSITVTDLNMIITGAV